MEYVRLGKTGLKVSRLCMGCMTYGEPHTGEPLPGRHKWTLGPREAEPFLRQALDAVIAAPDRFSVKPVWAAELGKVAEGSQITLGAYNRPWR